MAELSQAQRSTTILCADDTDAQRYAVCRILRSAGFEVMEAASGKQALEMMPMGPDLVVLDVQLPDISGLDVCRRIKANPQTVRIPVLHISATMISTEARVAGLEGGADAYLVQPVVPEELVATVRALLRVHQAEEAIWQSNQQYRLFFEATPLPCWVFDVPGLRILTVNEAAVIAYGYSREEFMRLTLRDIVVEPESPESSLLIERLPSIQGSSVRKHRKKDGSILEVEVVWAPIRLHRTEARLAIVQDITDKLKRQAAEQKEQMRSLLLERALQAQEEERQRIARELHDEAGQLLTSLLVGLRSLSDARRLADAKEQAGRLREIASEAIGELSRLARGLHSSVLDDLGLATALRRYADEFSAAHKVAIDLDLGNGDFSVLSRHEQLNLYRIIQEALTNVARHAKATRVAVHFERCDDELHVAVQDDGRGFQLSAIDNQFVQHLGIEGMRERAAMLGGALEICTKPQHGTSVAIRVPLGKQVAQPAG